MSVRTEEKTQLRYLKDIWDESVAASLDEVELLRYRSNLLGSDLRMTNFAGGNTSSKIIEIDPLDRSSREVLWVKGSGGDLGSMKRAGLAALYLEKLNALQHIYRGVDFEDEMADMYPLCTYKNNPVAASIDTPLHGFLPFRHVDHLHPDWAIALAASANGLEKMAEFNQRFNHHLIWIPWQRPGFELGLMMKRAIEQNPDCDGIVLGGHGLFTWGDTHRESYLSTLTVIDQLGQFVNEHIARKGKQIFGSARSETRADRQRLALEILPFLRGQVSSKLRCIASYIELPEVLAFVNSNDAESLAYLGTSCPDHFIRTKIRPLFIPWDPSGDSASLRSAITPALETYRKEYAEYYQTHAQPESPAMRDDNPSIVLIPGLGMFSFGKSKAESRITGEFYTNAIHVMEGASALAEGEAPGELPQAGPAAPSSAFKVHTNYVALPSLEAFRIEYWRLEEAKIRRQVPEKQLSRHIAVIAGAGSGIGREAALLAAEQGAHVVAADRDFAAAEVVASEVKAITGKEHAIAVAIDIRSREAIADALQKVIGTYGGVDILINTAAIFPSSPDGVIRETQWAQTLEINVTANYLLADEAASLFQKQALPSSIVLTSSANAVVSKRGSEAYDVSKAALSHLVRELAIGLAPLVRVNGVSPATVVKGSTMFPRDRVIASLTKYAIPFEAASSDDELRNQLAQHYAKRTLTHQSIDPRDCAQAMLFLAGPAARCTTGHLIPVDGGLAEAFLR